MPDDLPPAPAARQNQAPALVIGAGPAGLMAAEALAREGRRVLVFDQAPSPARKFLMAGRGGLNLTHSEPIERLLERYGAGAARLAPAIRAFSPEALRAWCETLGQTTFVGSSGRVFPASFKASPLLRAWLARLAALGVAIRPRSRFVGFDEAGVVLIESAGERASLVAGVLVLACGGASWPRLGSDGEWAAPLRQSGVTIVPLKPANCGFMVSWSPAFAARFSGAPLKTVALTFAQARVRGEAMVTAGGLEGGALYTLSGALREAIETQGGATLSVDLRPDVREEALASRLAQAPAAQSLATRLRKAAGLSPLAAALARESGPLPREAQALARHLKNLPLRLDGIAPIARAISSAGGIAWSEIDDDFMLRRRPGTFVAGEMIDWEAPTGGYLIQACLATGLAAGRAAARWLIAKETV